MLEAGLLYCGVTMLLAAGLLAGPERSASVRPAWIAALPVHAVVAGGLVLVVPAAANWLTIATGFAVAGAAAAPLLASLRPAAQVFLEVAVAALVGWTLWLGGAVFRLDVPGPGDAALGVLFLASLCLLPVAGGRLLLLAHMMGRRRWPRRPACVEEAVRGPRVSIHVPCCNEPPELVIATLDRLAALRYADYEVLVIDNNTEDPDLWRPVEAHCRALGSRFRFFHVEGLAGAKAGALNAVHAHTCPAAELVAVVDADYQVTPDFLGRLVPLFRDPAVGFVQCPHDYRDGNESLFKRACHGEYMPFQKRELPVRSQWCGGFTVGTLSLIRRRALEAAGRWAPWCLTEDSELAVRIHALGYTSFNLDRTFGRGLIPENFVRYRRQRFRWTAGPVQQLRRHWRLLLGAGGVDAGRLDRRQRLLELLHGAEPVQAMLTAVLAPLWVVGYGLAAVGGTNPSVPVSIIAAFTATLAAVPVAQGVLLRRVGFGWRAVPGSLCAHAALCHVTELAAARALFGRRPLHWHRTDKRRPPRRWRRALFDTRQEVGRSLVWLCLAAWLWSVAGPGSGPLVVTLICAGMASIYLAAPLLATLAETGRNAGHG